MSREDYDDARVQTILEQIIRATWKADMAQRDTRMYVLAAVEQGVSWRVIGAALGTSGQAAWQKYRPDKPVKINRKVVPVRIQQEH